MEKDEIWGKSLALLLENVEEDDPKGAFLNLLTPLDIFGDQFVLLAQNPQVESWVRKKYLSEIQETIFKVSGTLYQVGLSSISAQTAPPAQPETPPQVAPQPDFQPVQEQYYESDWMNEVVDPASFSSKPIGDDQVKRLDDTSQPERGDEGLFSKCVFDNFIVGKSNEFARGAALAVAEQPGIAYNPLFIYGGSGLGKTHLLVAIANYVMQNFPRMTTRYVSANTFLNDYVEATQRNQWGRFNEKYHQVDILLMDDVQYLEGKDETINQLFNIFNEMTNRNKQIVLSADKAPKDIDMQDRMRSRFTSGLLADIKPPDYETRLAILKMFFSRINSQTNFYGNISDEVLSYLAGIDVSNIRILEGAVIRLVSNMALLKKNNISVEEAQELLQDFFPKQSDKQIDIALIQNEVEHFFGISHEDMIGDKRSKGITMPRHIAIYLSRYMTEESLESIGRKFGGRDHTTIMHSVSKIEKDQKDNRTLYDQLKQLDMKIKGTR